MLKRICLITILLLGLFVLKTTAQSLVVVAGGNASGSGGLLNYSIGQIYYTQHNGGNGSVLSGVQQPFEISVITEISEAKAISIDFKTYPNPTSDILTIDIGSFDLKNMRFRLQNLKGLVIQERNIVESKTKIDFSILPPSVYFLSVEVPQKSGNRVVKTFKIIKK